MYISKVDNIGLIRKSEFVVKTQFILNHNLKLNIKKGFKSVIHIWTGGRQFKIH